jgi:uncharacterized membrane protein YsdA (DUF1294 family)/cold shock CspA family protein
MEQRGRLKSWNEQKGFGFIAAEQGGPDVFAHISALRGEARPKAGDTVLFVAGRDAQGRLRAEHIRQDASITLDRPEIRHRPGSASRATAGSGYRRPEGSRQRRVRRVPLKWTILSGFCVLPLWGSLQFLQTRHSLVPLIAYGLASVLAFGLYWYDKQSAQQGRWRTPEKTLHLCELVGGWPGALLAQQVFRHKTRKPGFQLLFWCIVLLHQVFWIDYLYLGRIFSSRFMQQLIG